MTIDKKIKLTDRYFKVQGKILASGTSILARLPLDQARFDRNAGLNTGGYVSGYRGSPLAGLDTEFYKLNKEMKESGVHFQPGVNEDLAATAVWGTQQLHQTMKGTKEGVFSLWYAKGPGVDRSMDAIRHGNVEGATSKGGVLLLVGDDHGASSSTVAHQSEITLSSAHVPVLHPSTLSELLEYGLAGWAISRATGCWVALKCQTELVESSAIVDLDKSLKIPRFSAQDELDPGLLYSVGTEPPLAAEKRMAPRLKAVQKLVKNSHLDRLISSPEKATIGIVTAGKAYLDLMSALNLLELDDKKLIQYGIRIYKIALTSPIDPSGILTFAIGLKNILVVEEKGPLIENQLRVILHEKGPDSNPTVIGKRNKTGCSLLSETGVLSPEMVANAVVEFIGAEKTECLKHQNDVEENQVPKRQPWFCAGCPHSTSTILPEGSRAISGIGCSAMSLGMDRRTDSFTQMGGEGMPWLGQMHYTDEKHIFVNMGDGTYYHSGLLAIRAAVAAKANVTYKILFNDVVAMTGGQVHDGPITPLDIIAQVKAEGVKKAVLVTNNIATYEDVSTGGLEIYSREELDSVQRILREIEGCTAIIYDQVCATENRRRRKRGKAPQATRRVFINEAVCEGCGDCTKQANCVAIEPLPTKFGTKRKINQSTCNVDASCIKGFCPSFVSLEGAVPRLPSPDFIDALYNTAELRDPVQKNNADVMSLLIAGIGGSGIVTVASLISMAAYIDDKDVTVLDQSGLAQKNGAVQSHIKISSEKMSANSARIGKGGANVIMACDAFTAAASSSLNTLSKDKTWVVANREAPPPVEFLANPDFATSISQASDVLNQYAGTLYSDFNVIKLANRCFGTGTQANIILLGIVWQLGLLPLSSEAILKAIDLNKVEIEENNRAFNLGRAWVQNPETISRFLNGNDDQSAEYDELEWRVDFLEEYQDKKWAMRFKNLLSRVGKRENELSGAKGILTNNTMKSAFKLMSYKDEYEVARLYSDPFFLKRVEEKFQDIAGIKFHLAPLFLPSKKDARGYPIKKEFGSWMIPLFKVLKNLKGLRGTKFDVFGWHSERRMERRLIEDYFTLIDQLLLNLNVENINSAAELAALPLAVRGYGPVKQKTVDEMKLKQEILMTKFITENGKH